MGHQWEVAGRTTYSIRNEIRPGIQREIRQIIEHPLEVGRKMPFQKEIRQNIRQTFGLGVRHSI
jgi:hypothetical protein